MRKCLKGLEEPAAQVDAVLGPGLEAAEHLGPAACRRLESLDHLRRVAALLGIPAELVIVRTEGRQRFNVLNVMPIKEIHDRWIGRHAANAVGLLARLKRDLEELVREEKSGLRRAVG
jgi:hypothetical protein